MSHLYRSPLAIRQLLRQRWGVVTAFLGVAVAILLMLMQLGFRDALLSSSVRPHAALAGELVVMSPQMETIEFPTWVSRAALDTIRGHPEVQGVRPLFVTPIPMRRLDTGELRNIRVLGIDPQWPALTGAPGLAEGMPELSVAGRALFDRDSRPTYGPIRQRAGDGAVVRLRLSLPGAERDHEVDVAGLFSMGPSLTSDGTLVVSDLTYRAITGQDLNRPTLGAVLLKPGADPDRVAADLGPLLGASARLMTKTAFMEQEKAYWASETPIGFIFDTGLLVGGIIGVAFVYQVLHGNITRNLSDYALLKSMGYPTGFFALVVMETSTIIGLVAFGPAVAAAWLLYSVTGSVTGLAMTLRVGDTLLVFGAVLGMSVLAGLLALRKLRDADPISLFT